MSIGMNTEYILDRFGVGIKSETHLWLVIVRWRQKFVHNDSIVLRFWHVLKVRLHNIQNQFNPDLRPSFVAIWLELLPLPPTLGWFAHRNNDNVQGIRLKLQDVDYSALSAEWRGYFSPLFQHYIETLNTKKIFFIILVLLLIIKNY